MLSPKVFSYYLKTIVVSTAFLFCMVTIHAQQQVTDIKTSKLVLDDFMDKRFGLFIHWGPVTLRGTEIGWSRGHTVPVKEYDNLYKEFNPKLFNADVWVKTAKEAGVKYLTITAKHHDGFCLWPTAYTSYNIMNTPFKKDVVGELAKACKKYGISFCIYFSVLDWKDANYPLHNIAGDTTVDPKANMNKFVITMKNELKELITNYHPYMLWFDGNWENPWTQEYGEDIYRYIKGIDKNVIINNRLGKGIHSAFSVASVGDFLTPEQKIGELNMNEPWVEHSGLTKGREYVTQEFIRDNSGNIIKDDQGHGLQPDVIISYPDLRKVIIDSKVSLIAWDVYVLEASVEEQEKALKSHIQSIRNHIDGLSRKNYPKYAQALDYVLLFIPIEPAFLEAVKTDTQLWKYAYDKKIMLVSPTNLLAVLKIIADLWKVELQNKNAIEIAERAGLLYDKFCGFLENLELVGKKIGEAQSSYDNAYKQLSTGRGHIIGKIEELKKMGANASKQLPDRVLYELE